MMWGARTSVMSICSSPSVCRHSNRPGLGRKVDPKHPAPPRVSVAAAAAARALRDASGGMQRAHPERRCCRGVQVDACGCCAVCTTVRLFSCDALWVS